MYVMNVYYVNFVKEQTIEFTVNRNIFPADNKKFKIEI